MLIYNFLNVQITQSNLWHDEKADPSTQCSHGNSRLNSRLFCSSCDIENVTFTCSVLSPLNSFICKTQRSPDTSSGNYYFFHCASQWLIKYTSLPFRNALFFSSYTQAPPWWYAWFERGREIKLVGVITQWPAVKKSELYLQHSPLIWF